MTVDASVRRPDMCDLVSDPRGGVLVLEEGNGVTERDNCCHARRAPH